MDVLRGSRKHIVFETELIFYPIPPPKLFFSVVHFYQWHHHSPNLLKIRIICKVSQVNSQSCLSLNISENISRLPHCLCFSTTAHHFPWGPLHSPVVLKCQNVSEALKRSLLAPNSRLSDSIILGRVPRNCISNQFPVVWCGCSWNHVLRSTVVAYDLPTFPQASPLPIYPPDYPLKGSFFKCMMDYIFPSHKPFPLSQHHTYIRLGWILFFFF